MYLKLVFVFIFLNIALFIEYVYLNILYLNYIIFILNNFKTATVIAVCILICIIMLLSLIIIYNVLSLYN